MKVRDTFTYKDLVRHASTFGIDEDNIHSTQDLMQKFPYVKITKSIDDEIYAWCQERFGDNWVWRHTIYFFHNESDAIMFRLKFQ